MQFRYLNKEGEAGRKGGGSFLCEKEEKHQGIYHETKSNRFRSELFRFPSKIQIEI